MRVKKRWLALLLAVCMLILCGCGKKAANENEGTAVVQETTKPAEETTEPVKETEEPAEETAEPSEETEKPVEETAESAEKTTETAEETVKPVEETKEPIQDTTAVTGDENEEATDSTGEDVFAAAAAEVLQIESETAADTEIEVSAEPEISAEPEASTEPKASAEPEEEAESDKSEPSVTEEEEPEALAEKIQAEEPEPAEETVLITEEPEVTEPEEEEPKVQRSIEITVPAEYADVRYRFGEITWNPDDSVTYRLTEEEHIQLLAEVHSDIQRELNEMCASPYFLDFFSMTANEDCTVFTVVCLSIETTKAEQKSIPQLYEFGKKFAAYEGREPGNIHIDYMNKIGNTFVMRDSERDDRPTSSR